MPEKKPSREDVTVDEVKLVHATFSKLYLIFKRQENPNAKSLWRGFYCVPSSPREQRKTCRDQVRIISETLLSRTA